MKCEKSVPLQGEKVQKQQTANVNKTRQIRLYLLMYLLMILLMILLMLYHLTVVYIKAPQPPLT